MTFIGLPERSHTHLKKKKEKGGTDRICDILALNRTKRVNQINNQFITLSV